MSPGLSSERSIGNQAWCHVRWWVRGRWKRVQLKEVAFREMEGREKTKGRKNRKCKRKEGERKLFRSLQSHFWSWMVPTVFARCFFVGGERGERGEALPLFFLRYFLLSWHFVHCLSISSCREPFSDIQMTGSHVLEPQSSLYLPWRLRWTGILLKSGQQTPVDQNRFVTGQSGTRKLCAAPVPGRLSCQQ